jgi:hypothetical protein
MLPVTALPAPPRGESSPSSASSFRSQRADHGATVQGIRQAALDLLETGLHEEMNSRSTRSNRGSRRHLSRSSRSTRS